MTLQTINLGTAPDDKTGDKPRIAGAKINSALAGGLFGRKRTIGFLGESNASKSASLSFASWLYWALAFKPRHLNYVRQIHDCSVSGSKSGAVYNPSTGAVTTVAVDGNSMNSPIIKAKAVAANVDDWFFSANGNDDNAYSSYRNNREMVDYLRANNAGTRFIFFSCVLPKTAPATDVFQLHSWMRQWAAITPDVFFVEMGHLLVNDATGYQPSSTGVPYAPIADAIGHIAPAGALRMGRYMNDFLDSIGGYPIAPLRTPHALDIYSTTNPGGNIFGIGGIFNTQETNAAYLGTNASGVTTKGCQISTDSPEVTVTGSMVTTNIQGNQHSALRLTIAATTTLTANRNVSCTLAAPGSAQTSLSAAQQAVKHRPQCVVNLNAVKDLLACQFQFGNTLHNIGHYDNPFAAAPTLTETMVLGMPADIDMTGQSVVQAAVRFGFPAGTTAGPLGSVDIAMAGIWGNSGLPTF